MGRRIRGPSLSLQPASPPSARLCVGVSRSWTLGPRPTWPVFLGYGTTIVRKKMRATRKLPHINPWLVSSLETAEHAGDEPALLAGEGGGDPVLWGGRGRFWGPPLPRQHIPAPLSQGDLEEQTDFPDNKLYLKKLGAVAILRNNPAGQYVANARDAWRPCARRVDTKSQLRQGPHSAIPRRSSVRRRWPTDC